MNAGIGLGGMICIAVMMVSSVGCRHSADAPTGAGAARIVENSEEYKTVEVEESTDQERAIAQMKERMQHFQAEGWIVLSVSKPLPQSDGTIHRKYSLRRDGH